jgi:hypothetical protein
MDGCAALSQVVRDGREVRVRGRDKERVHLPPVSQIYCSDGKRNIGTVFAGDQVEVLLSEDAVLADLGGPSLRGARGEVSEKLSVDHSS